MSDEPVDFNRDIRPLLSDNCFFCHGPDANTREAEYRLDLEKEAKSDRGGYFGIRESDAKNSEVISRIFSDDETEQMPPPDSGKKLTENQKQLIKKWIDQGAKWSVHWAYVPPKAVTTPVVESGSPQADWPTASIDRFLLKDMIRKGLAPGPDADRITLIRRAYFDLIGLPPKPSDVVAFVEDRSENAFEKVVDRLLASEHFGERMAVYWLDLVRYADTVGYHGDQDQNISPYRSWVISAFNANMAFDRFTREQLAGDLIADPSESQLVATGYNRLLQTTHEGGLQPREYRAMYAADRVRNLSAVWMGGTLGCAQCHDHKYDPYTAKDFYSMAAFFADIDDEAHFKNGTNSLPTRREPEILVLSEEQLQRLAERKSELLKLDKILGPKPKATNGNRAQFNRRQRLQEEIRKIESSGQRTMITRSLKQPRTTRILPRGNFLDESGAIVEPAIPEFMKSLGNIRGGKRKSRLDLANWLTEQSSVGLLTSRVFVNRAWYLLYGKGLTPDLDDFGGQGRPPVHPELLDFLSIEFVKTGWNVKALMKKMMMTRAYQLSSVASARQREIDPENRFFSHQTHKRLPAEFIRDTALAVSGLLEKSGTGESIKPYQPIGYYRNLNFPVRKYQHHADRRQYQRGVYVHWQRQFLHPMLRAFDAPRREECTAERPNSNTPISALVLLNDPTFVECARVLAENALSRQRSESGLVESIFMTALSRRPDEFEKQIMIGLYQQNLRIYEKTPTAATKLNSVGLKKVDPKLDPIRLAALTQVVRALFNLDEFVSRR